MKVPIEAFRSISSLLHHGQQPTAVAAFHPASDDYYYTIINSAKGSALVAMNGELVDTLLSRSEQVKTKAASKPAWKVSPRKGTICAIDEDVCMVLRNIKTGRGRAREMSVVLEPIHSHEEGIRMEVVPTEYGGDVKRIRYQDDMYILWGWLCSDFCSWW